MCDHLASLLHALHMACASSTPDVPFTEAVHTEQLLAVYGHFPCMQSQ